MQVINFTKIKTVCEHFHFHIFMLPCFGSLVGRLGGGGGGGGGGALHMKKEERECTKNEQVKLCSVEIRNIT